MKRGKIRIHLLLVSMAIPVLMGLGGCYGGYPADHGSSGIMTLIVSRSGKVYQKDLGPDTPNLARKIAEYDPDSSWALVK
jgi:hypothetical protein